MANKSLILASTLLLCLMNSISWAKDPIEPAQTQALDPDTLAQPNVIQESLVVDEIVTFEKLPEIPPEETFQPTSVAANLDEVLAPEPPPTEEFNFVVAKAEPTPAIEAPATDSATNYEALPAEPAETIFEPTSVTANLDDVLAPEPPATEEFNFAVAKAEPTPNIEMPAADSIITENVKPVTSPSAEQNAIAAQADLPTPAESVKQMAAIEAPAEDSVLSGNAKPEAAQNLEQKSAVAQAEQPNSIAPAADSVTPAEAAPVKQLAAVEEKVPLTPAQISEPVVATPPPPVAKEVVAPVAKTAEEKGTSIAEKAYQVLKETMQNEAQERAKLREEKETKAKPFPKEEVLTIELENPKKYNGLPKIAIEKVPGLAKDKSATYLTLKDAVQTAVVTNPEVLQGYKAFEGAVKDADAAWGKYLPQVDLNAYYGQENRNDPLVSRDRGRLGAAFERSQASLVLRQMLFDGFFTKTEVERLSRTSRARLFEMEEQSNATALETVKAYTDLLRFRRLTELSEDNYVAHKVIYEQLVIKAKAGVGKKSDVEQAKSRLSLAEYNMTVEGSNLHDIEARFQKVVGFLPPEDIDSATPVNKDIPPEPKLAINKAQFNNPKLLATIEDSLSQQALLDNKDAAFMPKLNLVMRADRGNNLNSFEGYHGNDVAEVVLSWNLFNGNSDVNFKKKERALLEAAINRRDKFCRDIRLELEIAYNDIKKLTEQYNYLDTRAISIEKARDAYRKQFEIGQRTLIDLLNTENELYEAKRLLTNVQNDLSFAYARTHYQMGTLLPVLDVTRYASSTTAPRPSSLSELGSNIAVCPAEAPMPYKANKKNLDSRASEFITAPKEEAPVQSENLNKDFKELTAPQ